MLEEKWTRTFGSEQREDTEEGPATKSAAVVFTGEKSTGSHQGRSETRKTQNLNNKNGNRNGRAFEVLVPKTRGGLMVNFDAIVRHGQNKVRKLLVQSLEEHSRVAKQGILRVGDEIREVNGLSVAGKFYEEILCDITRDKDDYVLLTVYRQGLEQEECSEMDKLGSSFVVKTRELVSQHSWDRLFHDV